jgi:hypothetical protein
MLGDMSRDSPRECQTFFLGKQEGYKLPAIRAASLQKRANSCFSVRDSLKIDD